MRDSGLLWPSRQERPGAIAAPPPPGVPVHVAVGPHELPERRLQRAALPLRARNLGAELLRLRMTAGACSTVHSASMSATGCRQGGKYLQRPAASSKNQVRTCSVSSCRSCAALMM